MIVAWMAALALLGGALCLYIAAPHQALLPEAVRSRRLAHAGGGLLLALALILLLTMQGPATAIFTWATGAMLVWSIVPVVVRWWRFRNEKAR